jgi:hypothetical protein
MGKKLHPCVAEILGTLDKKYAILPRRCYSYKYHRGPPRWVVFGNILLGAPRYNNTDHNDVYLTCL